MDSSDSIQFDIYEIYRQYRGFFVGLYFLLRNEDHFDDLKRATRSEFKWEKPEGCPDDIPLYELARGGYRQLAKKLSCHQFIVSCRDEISGCSEKAYDSLSINDAQKILIFSSDQELFEYVKEFPGHEDPEILASQIAFSSSVKPLFSASSSKRVPSTSLDSTASSTTRQVVSKTTSLSPRTPSVTNGSKGRSLTSPIDRSSGLSGRRKAGAPESRDSRFMMLPQVEIKAGYDVSSDEDFDEGSKLNNGVSSDEDSDEGCDEGKS
ncbi:hypothetical protein LOK49_LG12G02556 [Camellia lanceoleosa]|uniref:Uncharacterized protein n=1 Tax=Camellia lanceoleosa TaxID=1840588 RepID=A0ACC0FPH1_9ERIC|nr:hypothetical protein LOK49_LG12G02556 [Camellia lanceoleosa]